MLSGLRTSCLVGDKVSGLFFLAVATSRVMGWRAEAGGSRGAIELQMQAPHTGADAKTKAYTDYLNTNDEIYARSNKSDACQTE
jgi:hypothetical protein